MWILDVYLFLFLNYITIKIDGLLTFSVSVFQRVAIAWLFFVTLIITPAENKNGKCVKSRM